MPLDHPRHPKGTQARVLLSSVFGPYADRLLIPQLRELAGDYGVDGVWVDGECWATVPDYGAAALAAFRKERGFDTLPRKAGDPHWFEWMEFHREAFRKSSMAGILNYYKANYPREPYDDSREFPQVKCPVLMLHGLEQFLKFY